MAKIQLLPDSVANQIAAGEVIQRPASVIKELVENAVDAKATRIDVLITDAGRTSIQVIDNGIGMSVTDARLCFERHATSKIRKAEDLFSLHTMGFRGEALPSIAAVAQVTLKTRQEQDPVGVSLSISGSHLDNQETVSCPVGSNFLVENLFYNVPVRRRFLKSNTTEFNNIITAFQRIALVYPDITFSLHNNGQETCLLPAGSRHQRILDIFGKRLNQQLLPLEVETTLCHISGFVGKPESAKKKGAQQFFFVNGRYMKHPYFQKAVLSAYDRMIPQGEQVPFFLYFDMKPEDIDVNIHPTKTEIKFQDERSVWQILSAAVREAVGRFSSIPAIDFDTEGRPDIPVFENYGQIDSPQINLNPSYNPFNTDSSKHQSGGSQPASSRKPANGFVESPIQRSAPQDWEKLYEPQDQEQFISSSLFSEQQMASTVRKDVDRSKQHLQYKGAYILTSVEGGLMVTDQERAHGRILYERYIASFKNSKHASQRLLFPEMVKFNVAQMLLLPEILPEMTSVGFELTDLGGGSYAINAVPAGLEGTNTPQMVMDIVESVADIPSDGNKMKEEIFASLAKVMARNAAIPHGQLLSNNEMEDIISNLLECDNSRYSPDGKAIYEIRSNADIIGNL